MVLNHIFIFQLKKQLFGTFLCLKIIDVNNFIDPHYLIFLQQ